MGKVYRTKRNYDESNREFEKALQIIEQMVIKNKEIMAELDYEYGLLFQSQNEPIKARLNLSKALSIFEKKGMKLWVEKCKKNLSEMSEH